MACRNIAKYLCNINQSVSKTVTIVSTRPFSSRDDITEVTHTGQVLFPFVMFNSEDASIT